MTTSTPSAIVRFGRSRRSAAVAGIIFAVLLLAAMIMWRLALSDGSFQSLQSDSGRRTLIRLSLNLVPFAGIAFLWFIGVVRDQLGDIEDRLFSTVFLGSGLLFLAMLFIGAVTSTSLMEMLAANSVNADVWEFGRDSTRALVSVYAMRMAAVFTLSVSTVGLRTGAMPRWVVYLGYLTAAVLLLAAGEHQWVQLVFPTWVLLVSLVILFTRPVQRPGPSGD
jgi:preprotein translocase subunit Sec61beta